MRKRPFLMALLVLGAIFLFFIGMVYVLSGLSGRSTGLPLGERVGVIEIKGILDGSETTIDHLLSFKKDDSIKAIVLRIDSPGGGVGPSQEIYEEIQKTVKVKPVVVSMGSIAASGGYYVAAPSARIFANPGTITGSIGVILEFTNFQELLEKIGLKSQVIKSGAHKDIGSPVRPMTAEEREILQSMIDDVHRQFVQAVAQGRNLDVEKVERLADGRIFSGRQALDLGLVDELGNLQDAIRAAATMGGIMGEPKVVYPPREKPWFIEYFVEETATRLAEQLSGQKKAGLNFLWNGVN